MLVNILTKLFLISCFNENMFPNDQFVIIYFRCIHVIAVTYTHIRGLYKIYSIYNHYTSPKYKMNDTQV